MFAFRPRHNGERCWPSASSLCPSLIATFVRCFPRLLFRALIFCGSEEAIEDGLRERSSLQRPQILEQYLLDVIENFAEDTSMADKTSVQQLKYAVERAATTGAPLALIDVLVLAECHARCLDRKDSVPRAASRAGRVLSLLPLLRNEGLLTSVLIADRFSHELEAFAVGLGVKENIARNMYVRINTRANLVQVRYNTLREEADGFNKLLLLLSPPFLLRYPDVLASRILAITGAFELDSYRVLDLVLDCLEHVPSNTLDTDFDVSQLFVHLLRHQGNSQALLGLLSFKFSSYSVAAAAPTDSTSSDSTTPTEDRGAATPRGLFSVTALLIKAGLIPVEGLLPYLSPPDATMFALTKQLQEQADYAFSNPTSKPALEMAIASSQGMMLESNQKLRLLEAMLRVDDWARAELLLARWSDAQPARFPSIAKLVCRQIHRNLEPLYLPFSPRSFIFDRQRSMGATAPEADSLRNSVAIPILRHLGAYIAFDPPLLYKFVRTLAGIASHGRGEAGVSVCGPLDDLVEDLAVRVLLPAVSLIPLSPVASCEVWSLLRCYHYSLRYRVYFHSRQPSGVGLEVNIRRASQMQDIRAILRRVTIDRVKEDGRKIGRLALSTPGVVFHHVLQQLQSYSNFIEPMADALKFVTPLGADILAFLLIESLSRPEALVKSDGQNSSQWLSGLSSFCGGFYRRYGFRTDLEPILVYIQNQLRRNSPWHLLVFKQILSKMASVDVQEEAYDEDLLGLNSAPTLRDLVRLDGVMQQATPSSRSAVYALVQGLRECKLSIPLYTLIVRVRQAAAYALEGEDRLRVVADLTDRSHQVLLQYAEFLRRFVINMNQDSSRRLASWFPPLAFSVLCGSAPGSPNGIPIHFAFHLLRPILPILFSELTAGGQYMSAQDLATARHECAKVAYAVPLVNVVAPFVPVGAPFSNEFFAQFWSLSLYDIHFSENVYQVKKKLTSAMEANLGKQRLEHSDRVASVFDSFKRSCESWFSQPEPELAVLIHCILPRLRVSAEDALFAGYFLNLLNRLSASNWSPVRCLRALFRLLRTVLAGSTEDEAHRLGRTIKVVWLELATWRDDVVYLDRRFIATTGLEYRPFLSEALSWEEHIRAVVVRLLRSTEKTDARNALLLLSRVSSVFPTYTHVLSLLLPHLEKMSVATDDSKKDLALLATNILRLLRDRTGLLSDAQFREASPAPALQDPDRTILEAVDEDEQNSKKRQRVEDDEGAGDDPLQDRPAKLTKMEDDGQMDVEPDLT